MKKYLLILLFLLFPTLSYAAGYCGAWGNNGSAPWTVSSDAGGTASLAVADINYCIATTATAGDTINIPAGSATWTTAVTMTKSVKLIGAGGDLGETGAARLSCAAGNTCITINNSSAWIITTYNIGDSWRISGIAFIAGDVNYLAIYGGVVDPSYKNWRIDHCKFVGFHFATYFKGVAPLSGDSPLIDNNEFYGGGVQFFGVINTPWAAATSLGTANFVFIENNKFSDLTPWQTLNANAIVQHFIATNNGARIVARYNDFKVEETGPNGEVGDILDAHGYCHGSSVRAVRAYEVYNNKQTQTSSTYCSEGVYLRGGTGVVHHNQFGCTTYGRGMSVALYDYRASTMDATGTDDCSASCATNASQHSYCYSTYYRLKTTAEPACAFSNDCGSGIRSYNFTVTGSTSGAHGLVTGITNSGVANPQSLHYFLIFQSVTGGPFQNGETLTSDQGAGTTAAAAQETVNGEGAESCCDMIGKGNAQASDPVYIWSNTDKNDNALNDAAPAGMVAGYIVENTDYYKSAKGGYSIYTCPHPTAGTGTCSTSIKGTAGYALGGTTYTITVTQPSNGSVSPATEVVSSGATVTPTYTAPGSGAWKLSAWSGCGLSGNTNPTTFTATTDCTITVTEAAQYLAPWYH